ncbi:MAG TPA: hypothetical protein VD905_10565, partial [Flavobacteriales bacterium]|nr:hypothetical protein [Flavobacteriales bacterium]
MDSIILKSAPNEHYAGPIIAFFGMFLAMPLVSMRAHGFSAGNIIFFIFMIILLICLVIVFKNSHSFLKIDSEAISYNVTGINNKPSVEWEYKFSEIVQVKIEKTRMAKSEAIRVFIFETPQKMVEKKMPIWLNLPAQEKIKAFASIYHKNKILVE